MPDSRYGKLGGSHRSAAWLGCCAKAGAPRISSIAGRSRRRQELRLKLWNLHTF